MSLILCYKQNYLLYDEFYFCLRVLNLYLKILNHFNISSDDAVIVEDSPKGIEAGKLSKANVYEVNGYYDVTLENILKKINYFNMM